MKGILFKPDMLKAIKENRKTVTRRLDGLKEINQEPDKWQLVPWRANPERLFERIDDALIHEREIVKPRYSPGEIVYVKEGWFSWGDQVVYKSDGAVNILLDIKDKHMEAPFTRWRPPLFMPARYARTFLKILSVRPERLQEISEDDVIQEGIPRYTLARGCLANPKPVLSWWVYQNLWDSINPDFPWKSNPWVWRIEFQKTEKSAGRL